MDRSRRSGAKQPRPQPPSSSRLTFKARTNRRRPGSAWSRVPKPVEIADACGRALRRSLPAFVAAAVLIAVGGTAWAGFRFVTTSPRFAITAIEVHGNQQLTADQIRSALPARIGDNVFATSLDDVVRAVRANPWIAGARTHRILPHTLVIEVREHVPAAVAELGGLYLVDDRGYPFKRAAPSAGEGAGLPIVTGLDRAALAVDPDAAAAQIRGALGALALWRDHPDRPSIGEVHVDAKGGLTLVTYERAIGIRLGSPPPSEPRRARATSERDVHEELGRRMRTFDATWVQLTDDERARARAIHVDAHPNHVTVALATSSDR